MIGGRLDPHGIIQLPGDGRIELPSRDLVDVLASLLLIAPAEGDGLDLLVEFTILHDCPFTGSVLTERIVQVEVASVAEAGAQAPGVIGQLLDHLLGRLDVPDRPRPFVARHQLVP